LKHFLGGEKKKNRQDTKGAKKNDFLFGGCMPKRKASPIG